MMEFMLARVSACICAAIIIGLLFNPVTDTLMDNAEDEANDNCDALGASMDRFMSSDAQEMTLFLNVFLPDSESRIKFVGQAMMMDYSDTTRAYLLRWDVESDSESYGYADAIRLTKDDGAMVVETISF